MMAADGDQSPRRSLVLKVSTYVVGVDHWPMFNQIYKELFGMAKRAHAVIPVLVLNRGYSIEVEAVARQGNVA